MHSETITEQMERQIMIFTTLRVMVLVMVMA
jgi:hypothetical protein